MFLLKRIKNQRLRFFTSLLLALALFTVAWYALGRMTAPLRAVSCETIFVRYGLPPRFNGRLIIAAYNVAHGRGTSDSNWQRGAYAEQLERLDRIAGLLKSENADIVVLNEVDFSAVWSSHLDQATYIAEKAGYPYLVKQVNMDASFPLVRIKYGNAILSRFEINEAERIDLPDYSSLESLLIGYKRACLCNIKLDGKNSIEFLGLHLEHRSEEVRFQAMGILKNFGDYERPAPILAGDFNSTMPDYPYAETVGNGITTVSALLKTGYWKTLPDKKPDKPDYTFDTTDPSRVIDWILAPSDWKIIRKEVKGGKNSDHFAVFMEVEVPPWRGE